MPKSTASQLSFIEEPLHSHAPTSNRAGRRRMSPEMTAQHCNALLAQLDRVINDQHRIESLAQLFEAAERAAARAEQNRAEQNRAEPIRSGQSTQRRTATKGA